MKMTLAVLSIMVLCATPVSSGQEGKINFGTAASAKQAKPEVGVEYILEPISGGELVRAGEKPVVDCGPHFSIPGGAIFPGMGVAADVYFHIKGLTAPEKVARNLILTMIDEDRETPTIEYLEETRFHRVRIRLSTADQKSANRCIPEATQFKA